MAQCFHQSNPPRPPASSPKNERRCLGAPSPHSKVLVGEGGRSVLCESESLHSSQVVRASFPATFENCDEKCVIIFIQMWPLCNCKITYCVINVQDFGSTFPTVMKNCEERVSVIFELKEKWLLNCLVNIMFLLTEYFINVNSCLEMKDFWKLWLF